jgi:hypothetical protein
VPIFGLKDSIDTGSRRANNLAGTGPISRIKKIEIPGGELDILGPDILHKDASIPAKDKKLPQRFKKVPGTYVLKKRLTLKILTIKNSNGKTDILCVSSGLEGKINLHRHLL